MWLDRDGDSPNLGHAVLGRVLGVLVDHTFTLVGLGPVLLEKAFANPFMP